MVQREENGEILRSARTTLATEQQQNAKIVINVGGIRHETYVNTLRNIPDTRLFWITENGTQLADYDAEKSEYFFDRHPGVFVQILNFYRTGKLHCPMDVCGPLFEEELSFWGIDELQVESCCWLNYKKHREAQANLETFDSVNESDGESINDMDMAVYGLVADAMRNRNKSLWKKIQPRVWTTFEEPYSSCVAQVIAFMTLILILASVVSFCLESVPYFMEPSSVQSKALSVIEVICVAWFTLEFLLRFTFCPNKWQFVKKFMNWIDLGAVLPFYIQLFLSTSNLKTIIVLRVVRLIRVFRIFKLSRHSYGLQILGHTLRASFSELFLLVFFLSIGVIIFSSIIFYAEKDVNPKMFPTIPHSFWWAVVTMTTLGYGDVVPISWQGKIVGSLCAVCGVLMIALPVPVIVSNFSLYYSHAKARLKLPKRKRPLILGAANALKVSEPFPKEENPNIFTEIIRSGSNSGDESYENNQSRKCSLASRRTSNCPSVLNSPIPRKRLHSLLPLSSAQHPESHPHLEEERINGKRRHTLAVPYIEHIPGEIEMHELPRQTHDNDSKLKKDRVTSNKGDLTSLSVAATNSVSQSPKPSDNEVCPATLRKASWRQTSSTGSNGGSNSISVDSTGSPVTNPYGRMGRRGSLYIVGFTAKHWQNKALKNKNQQKLNTTQNTETVTKSTYSVDKENPKSNSFLTPDFGSASFGSARSSFSDTNTNTTDVSFPSTKHIPESSIENSREQLSPVQRVEFSSEEILEEKVNRMEKGHPSNSTTEVRKSVNSGTQSSCKQKSEPISSSVTNVNLNVITTGENFKNGKCMQTSVSIDSNDSSSKLSDDSMTKYEPHRRRASSPLIRQKAVFTFDMSDQEVQVDLGGVTEKYKSCEESWSALSPLTEQVNEISSGGENTETSNSCHNGQNSCVSPPSSPLHSSPLFAPASYVNDSFRHDNEDLSEKKDYGCNSERKSVKTDTDGSQQARTLSDIDHIVGEMDKRNASSPLAKRSTGKSFHSETSLPSITEEDGIPSGSLPASHFYGHFIKESIDQRHHSLPSPFVNGGRPILTSRANSNPTLLEHKGTIHETPNRSFHGEIAERGRDNFGFNSSSKDSVARKTEMEGLNNSSNMNSTKNDLLQRRNSQALHIDIPQQNGHTLMENKSLHAQYTVSDSAKIMRDMATSPLPLEYLVGGADQKARSFTYPLNDLHQDMMSVDQIPTAHVQRSATTQFNTGDIKIIGDDRHQYSDYDNNVNSLPKVSSKSTRKYSVCSIPNNIRSSANLASYHDSRSINNYDKKDSPILFESSNDRFPSQIHLIRSSTDNLQDDIMHPTACNEKLGSIRSVSSEATTSERFPFNEGIHRGPGYPEKVDRLPHRDGTLLSPTKRKIRTEKPSAQFYQDPWQSKDNFRKSPTTADRWRARAMFFGDSGISSVGSNSTASITRSTDSENDAKERRESVSSVSRIDILNPIHETETETNTLVKHVVTTVRKTSVTKETPHRNSSVPEANTKVDFVSMRARRDDIINILNNPNHYETSLV